MAATKQPAVVLTLHKTSDDQRRRELRKEEPAVSDAEMRRLWGNLQTAAEDLALVLPPLNAWTISVTMMAKYARQNAEDR